MISHVSKRAFALALGLCGLQASGSGALAQSPADFYRGKNVNVLIGVGVGGEYDLHARLVARHIGKHIPGAPAMVPQNMTGAGGAKMGAFLADVAPKDGTNIGMMANNFPAMQAAGVDVIRFDLGKFQWIGSICPTVETMTVWTKTAGVSSIEEARAREVIAGASGRGAITYSFPAMLNEFVGTKFKIVTGYPGGNEINLAMERGEVQARNNTWSSWKVTKPEWIKNGDIKILAYAGPKPADLPGVPDVTSLVKSDDDRRIVELIVSGTRLGRPLAFAGGVPDDRVKAVREAFMKTMTDDDFVKEAAQMKIEIDPVRGEDMQKVVADVLATPKHLAARARALIE
ncbi:MAG: Bug family tripartite tricarboxylate transporter substrate binding protein [Beijerinckiaceae bacterium]|jgi:tripartite-type tricarboxylate transporter receptor subunit TctC